MTGHATPGARVGLSALAGVSAAQLDAAVARGIITAEQRDRLLALDAVPPSDDTVEPRGTLNLVTVGYWAGSLAVLFALAWFLVDRWKSLRPGGVLAVALLYAVGFALSSVLLRRLGFRLAASLLTLLVVGMAPIIMWCIESLLGLWPAPAARRDFFSADVIASVRWIPLQLSLALAALVALRRDSFGLLVLAVTIPTGMALVHLTPWLLDPELSFYLEGWMTLLAAALLLIAASVVDRRTAAGREDAAGWVYLTALGFLFVGLMMVADQSRLVPHSLPVTVALLVALGITLHRRVFMLPAILLFISYLVFLAREVFPTAVGFMTVMLLVGALLILGTVLAQRRFPGVIRRLSGEGAPRRTPTGVLAIHAGLAVLSIVLLGVAIPRGRAELRDRQNRRNEMYRAEVERQRSAQRAATARVRREGGEGETPGAPRP